MTIFAIEGALAILVIVGSTMLVWGVRRFHVSSRVVAITFALTALSWLAFIIATIGITMWAFVLPSA